MKLTRRDSLRAIAVAAVGVVPLGIGATTTEAAGAQFHMDAALVTLRLALRDLNNATEDKGGHRGRAIKLLKQVIAEVELGIQYASPH